MKILLIGEASNLHWTLAEGLRANGHTVTVVSHGSHWLNNKRDVSIVRRGYDLFHSIQYMADIIRHLPQMRGYDVVQVTNPVFFDLRPEKNWAIFKYLKSTTKDIPRCSRHRPLLCKSMLGRQNLSLLRLLRRRPTAPASRKRKNACGMDRRSQRATQHRNGPRSQWYHCLFI